MLDSLCVVCRRREPTCGSVCNPDLLTMQKLLDDMPRKLRALPLMLVPGQSPGGDRVATTRAGSPTPTRLDALSLVGPGGVPVPGALHPLVRRRSSRREVTVTARVGTYRVDRHRIVLTEWHQETVTDDAGAAVMVPDDDQAGVLPPGEWLEQWVRRWQVVFGHSPPRPDRGVPQHKVTPPDDQAHWILRRGTPEQVAALVTAHHLHAQWRQGVTDLVVGNEPGYAGNRPAHLREDDPVADAWTIRFGQPEPSGAALANIAYLRTWLVRAAERDEVDLAPFAAELRSLSAELTRVLGEQPDQQWLGKCPAQLSEPGTEDMQYCGAGLWQDPHASVVQCPRCHSSWGPRDIHLVLLAAEIRRVWPLDRRRRYNAEEIDALRPVPCPGCAGGLVVHWQHVTGTGDTRRWWRPAATTCRKGCAKADIL